MRILSYYPIHKTFLNSIASLFPNTKFDLARTPQIICGEYAKIWNENFIPFESNIHILDEKWNEIDDSKYDLRITWFNTEQCLLRKWSIPSVYVALNRGDPVLENQDVVIYLTKFVPEGKHSTTNRQIYLTVGSSHVGRWTGEDNRAYFIDQEDWKLRWSNKTVIGSWASTLIETLEEVRSRVPFYFPEKRTPWETWITERQKLRVYVDISFRAICCTFFESLFMGQPVVVPNWPEFNLIIKHGENGFLYRTKEECARLAGLLINDYDLARKLGAAGRETAERIAGDDIRRKQWTEAFNLALEKKGKQ
jgi:hypothetical protein